MAEFGVTGRLRGKRKMIRHELEDGEWYLLKKDFGTEPVKYNGKTDKFKITGEAQLSVQSALYCGAQWIKISPEQLFKDAEHE